MFCSGYVIFYCNYAVWGMEIENQLPMIRFLGSLWRTKIGFMQERVGHLPQSDGGCQCVVVELGALWLWVKALWWLLGATEPGARSVSGLATSGSCTEQVFTVGLETGEPWTGGDGHGEPREDTCKGGKPGGKNRFGVLKYELLFSTWCKTGFDKHLVVPVVCYRGGWTWRRLHRRRTWSGS